MNKFKKIEKEKLKLNNSTETKVVLVPFPHRFLDPITFYRLTGVFFAA